MSDAIGFEQRLHDMEQRLHDLIVNLRSRQAQERSGNRESASEMGQQAVQRLFSDQSRGHTGRFLHDVATSREMERQAIERLYGDRSGVVTRTEPDPGDEDS
jgi:hypothetical protein